VRDLLVDEGVDAGALHELRARRAGMYGMVIPNFVRQALANEPITVYGDGKQSRCFTHVADVVRAFIDLMDKESSYGEVFNIGNPVEISIVDLAKKIKDMIGSKSEIVFIPYEKAYEAGFEDMARRISDIGKIGKQIGWKPTIGLEQILTDVIEFQRTDS
jgi:UDP-glucose 4-epimerase